MFFAVIFPLADFRYLHKDTFGRLERPAWGNVDPKAKFARGFGPIHRRTKSGLGFAGEEFYADCDRLVRFPDQLKVRPFLGEQETIPVYPIFRRFYFDGIFSGKFEFGFRMDEQLISHYAELSSSLIYSPENSVCQLLDRPTRVTSLDGRTMDMPLSKTSSMLRDAYLSSSTASKFSKQYPVNMGRSVVSVEKPFVFVRTSNSTEISDNDRRRPLLSEPFPRTYLSRSKPSLQNFDTVLQPSTYGLEDETNNERAIRLVYCQFRMIITAYSFYTNQRNTEMPENSGDLGRAVKALLERISEFSSVGNEGETFASNAKTAILQAESIDFEKIALEIQATIEPRWWSRYLGPLTRFLDKKADVAIEAFASAATSHALRGVF